MGRSGYLKHEYYFAPPYGYIVAYLKLEVVARYISCDFEPGRGYVLFHSAVYELGIDSLFSDSHGTMVIGIGN